MPVRGKATSLPERIEATSFLGQEKKDEQAERTRLRGQSARERIAQARLQEAPVDGGHEPGDDADGSRPVVATSPAVGGHEPELKRRKVIGKTPAAADTAGLSSASCAAAAVEPGCGSPSASCAAATGGLSSDDDE